MKGGEGKYIRSNIGIFRGSPTVGPLFIIYGDSMLGDYDEAIRSKIKNKISAFIAQGDMNDYNWTTHEWGRIMVSEKDTEKRGQIISRVED